MTGAVLPLLLIAVFLLMLHSWNANVLHCSLCIAEALQARLEAEQARAEAAVADAQGLRQALAEKELLLVAAAPANGDMGEDSVRVALLAPGRMLDWASSVQHFLFQEFITGVGCCSGLFSNHFPCYLCKRLETISSAVCL